MGEKVIFSVNIAIFECPICLKVIKGSLLSLREVLEEFDHR